MVQDVSLTKERYSDGMIEYRLQKGERMLNDLSASECFEELRRCLLDSPIKISYRQQDHLLSKKDEISLAKILISGLEIHVTDS